VLSGEHGIGLEKRDLMPLLFGADDLAAQDCTRAAFDPQRRLNPGKVLPSEARCGDFAMAAGRTLPRRSSACRRDRGSDRPGFPRRGRRGGGHRQARREVGHGDRCRGAAGLYNVLEPEMADRLKREKASSIQTTGAPAVLVANPGCAMQIAAGLADLGSRTPVLHPAELLDQAYTLE
jgi:hypothetical protein